VASEKTKSWVLVFYALCMEDLPLPGDPSLVVREETGLRPDSAPIFSIQSRASFLEELASKKGKGAPEAWERVHAWAKSRGEPAIAYQLEPPEIAGDGTACLVLDGRADADTDTAGRPRPARPPQARG
jgi:hypothetical protein